MLVTMGLERDEELYDAYLDGLLAGERLAPARPRHHGLAPSRPSPFSGSTHRL
jgi:hypothetical protein